MKVQKFIELTHEKYYAELSEYFGDTIIAFFTDEPNILGRNAVSVQYEGCRDDMNQDLFPDGASFSDFIS